MASTSTLKDERTALEVARDQAEEFWHRIQGLEEDIAEKRREIKRLERKLSKYESEGVAAGVVDRQFELWRNLTGHTRAVLTPDRRKALVWSNKHRGEAETDKIIVQGSKSPYLVYGKFKASGADDSLRDELADWLMKGKYADQLLLLSNTIPDVPVNDNQIADWHDRLLSNETVCQRVNELKGWTPDTLEALGVGFDGQRLVFPVRDEFGLLTGAVRYFPGERGEDQPKSVAVGSRGLFPAPESIDGGTVWLVEGEPDAITAHEMYLPGVAVPGAGFGPGVWMERLKGRRVIVCFDCDEPGRKAANRIARPLAAHAAEVRIVDLDPKRSDGYDLSDWFRSGRQRKTLEAMARIVAPVSPQQPLASSTRSLSRVSIRDTGEGFNRFVRALEARDCDPKEKAGGQWESRCPAHDDRVPTLHFKRGDTTPVVADCKAGCSWDEISESLGHPTHRKAA